jgi:hypothetical protein
VNLLVFETSASTDSAIWAQTSFLTKAAAKVQLFFQSHKYFLSFLLFFVVRPPSAVGPLTLKDFSWSKTIKKLLVKNN